jgi:tetratricopeptide (TPR) repeat protein
MLGTFAYYEGRWDEAADFYRRSRDARERMGDPANASVATANLAELLVDQGRIDEASADLLEAETIWLSTGDEWGVAFSRRLRGIGRARTHEFDLAEELLDASRATFDRMGARGEVIGTDVCIAEMRLLQGRPRETLEIIDQLRDVDLAELGCHHLVPAIHRLRGLALDATGVDGREDLSAALDAARDGGADHEIALALDALATVDRRAGRPVDAAGSEEALSIAARLGIERRLAAADVFSRT